MTTNIEQFSSAGIETIHWARNNAAGYPFGPTGTLANGADASLSRLLGVNNFNLPLPQPRQVNVPGDDSTQSVFFFQPESLPNGDLAIGVFDVNFFSQAQGTKVYADGDFDVIVGAVANPTYNQMTIVTCSQAQSKMSGSSGQAGFMVKIYPKVQVVPLADAGLGNAAATSFTHALIANKSDKLPWGTSFTVANHGTTEAAVYGPFYSENRVCLHTHVSDASDLSFTLAYTPAAATTNKVKAWRNGTPLTYTTDYSVSGTTFTLVAAGTAADVVVVRYEYSG